MGTRESAEQGPRAAQVLPLLGVHVKSSNCPLLPKGVYCVCVGAVFMYMCAGVCVWESACVCMYVHGLCACMWVRMHFCILLPQVPLPPSSPQSALSWPGPASSSLYSLNISPSR